MIEKPEQYYDTRRHQLYYQWRESEYFSHQEPIYHRTREYIESLEAENAELQAEMTELEGTIECLKGLADATSVENAKLRELVRCLVNAEHPSDRATLIANAADMLAELGVEVES